MATSTFTQLLSSANVVNTSTNKTKIVCTEMELFFLSFFLPAVGTPHVYMRAWTHVLLSQSYKYPNLSEGADSIGGQLRGDKECPFSGVTKSGRVWRKCRKAVLGLCVRSSAVRKLKAKEVQLSSPAPSLCS